MFNGAIFAKDTDSSHGNPWSIQARKSEICAAVRRRALLGHDVLRVNSRHQFNQKAFLASSRNNREAGVTLSEDRLTRVDLKTTFGAAFAMAIDAALPEDWLDILGEINGTRRRRWQTPHLLGRHFGHCPLAANRQDQPAQNAMGKVHTQ